MCSETSGHRRVRKSGFTLIELTAVLALMAVLAGLVAVNVRHYILKGKQNAARTEIGTICTALEEFHNLFDRYPTNSEGLTVLAQPSEKAPEGLLTKKPIDPWGHPYQYNVPGPAGQPYEVISFGADGREGGEGADADISSTSIRGNAGREARGTKN
jgi:general secretion pathway protein G